MKEINEDRLIKKVKEKKELAGLADSLVREIVVEYLKKHNIRIKGLGDKEVKIIVKEVRERLREFSGRFQKSRKDRFKLLEEGKIEALLRTHSSTAERIGFYPRLKEMISSLKVKSILDIGAGLNPIALADKSIKYYAIDVKEDELELVSAFFRKNEIEGKVFVCDLRKELQFPKAELCLLFKVLDIIDDKSYKFAKRIIDNVKSEYILISFATRTLSGRRMKHWRRKWLERLLESKGYKYRLFNSDNEIFYFVERGY